MSFADCFGYHVMSVAPIDQMIEFALEELLSGDISRCRALVRKLCQKWPSEPALCVVFALTSAASMVEDNFKITEQSDGLSLLAYKLVALLAADVYAVESMGHKPAKARDLLHFWRRVDGYFLDL
ncbi:hypothetical protein [Aliiroseovarius lamellibrachiae]|uniref:hypothetical protein n=1 Tax=Aliiroseovarius lamellibrachiae TaxID=1924933 RepID=UPI001BE0AF90|nr:hypothetical protein [Aliiroseovarius lamellibrachiae]